MANIFGTNGDDFYAGTIDFDLLFASLGNDTLDGGADTDVAIYDVGLFTNGVFINNTDTAIGTVLANTADKRGFGTDTLVDVSNFHGTEFNDTIYVGGEGETYTFDKAGDDLVVASQGPTISGDHYFGAGSGNDTLIGTVNRDRVDYSNEFDILGAPTQGVNVDLESGVATDGWGFTDQLTSIERVTGTNLNDTIRGNDDRNDFSGLQGDDLLDGRGGDRDRAEYGQDPSAVFVDLSAGTATDGWGDTDTLIGIEQVRGSEFNDTILGSEGRDGIEGEGGDDLIRGFGDEDNLEGDAGNDTLDGGEGFDVIGHFDDPMAVLVDLSAGTVIDGWGDTDTLISIEGVDGSRFGDTLRGDDGDNFLDGREGDDLLEGFGGEFDNFRGSQGNDTIDGGDGRDRVEYNRDADRGGSSGVVVDLVAGSATDGFGDTDTLISIEDVRGTQFDDTLTGNDETNRFEPGEGSDSIVGGADTETSQSQGDELAYFDVDSGGIVVEFTGGGDGTVQKATGNDTFSGIEEIFGTRFDDLITGNLESEWLGGEAGNDTIIGNEGNDDLSGREGDDFLDGGIGGDFLQPGAGADTVIGGENGPLFEDDELSYGFDRDATTGVEVTFTSETDGSVLDWSGSTDVFTGIERVRGTAFDDTFIGAEGDQQFRGLGGDDFFDGGDGDRDRVDYSRADDDTGAFQGINVSLTAGGGTDANGDTDTFVNIEEIRGSQFDDVIIGDLNKNELQGEQGDDLIDSFGGVDNFLDGGRGNDTLEARGDSDFASGGEGNDLITFFGIGGGANPGLGSDTIVGGTEGFFSLDYFRVGNDLIIDVEAGTTTIVGSPDTDTFTNIVNVGGSEGNDTLLGNEGERQEFFSSLGDDFIDGRGDGSDGDRDWLIYNINENDFSAEEAAVIVDFSAGTASGIHAGNDTFVNIEAVRGSHGDDLFVGSDQAYEEYQAMAGNDTIEGGDGEDRLSYTFEDNRGGTLALNIDLAGPVNADGYLEITDTFGDTDFVSGIEQVNGSFFDDFIAGDEGDNLLIGGDGGNDTLLGRGGNDRLWGGQGTDSLTGGTGADEFQGFINFLDGDTITDFSAEDSISIFDGNFNQVAANAEIVGNELRLDTDGDGVAEATLILENGYTGPVNVNGGPIGGPVAAVFSVADAGAFTAVVDEGDVVANVTVTRTGDLTSTATVDVTLTGTGVNPADASDVGVPFEVPITLTFVPGQDQIVYQIGITDDLDVESFEDLAFTLSNATSDGAGGAEISGAQTFVRILDNDVAPSVRVDGEKRNEDAGEIVFTVSRTGDLSEAITVPYEITSAGGLQGAEADDLVGGLPQSGSVVIAAGEALATFTIAVAPDTEAELHDDIVATISVGDDWPDGLNVSLAQATGSIRNDDGVPPVLPTGATGSNYGDPHIVTLDGLAYDFQAVGEFTLIEAASGDPLEVQVRFQPVEGSQVASQTTAVATSLGAARVVIDVDGSSLVSVDGVAFDLNSAVGGASVGNGDIYYDGEAITLVYINGEQLRVDLFDGFLSTSVSIAAGHDVRGLLGNADGDASNDLALRDGTVLAQPVSFDVLYGAFADDWRLSDATSLFDYPAGQGTADFTDLSFPVAGVTLDDFPIEVVAVAEEAAAGIEDPALREAAILDYLVSGNTAYIDAAMVVDEGLDALVIETAPDDAPAIPAGIGISVSDAEIVEGDSGEQDVTFTIYRTGDTSESLSVGYSVGGSADGADYEGSLEGTLFFEEGQASQTIVYQILGDTAQEDNETLELQILVDEGGPVVISSTSKVTIVNDDIAPQEPELNPVEGTDTSDFLLGTDGDDLITGFGGRFDALIGKAGADVFVFGEETYDGARDRDAILDYEVGVDSILLTDGAEVKAVRDTFWGAVVKFEGGKDALYIYGSDVDDDNIAFVYDDTSIA